MREGEVSRRSFAVPNFDSVDGLYRGSGIQTTMDAEMCRVRPLDECFAYPANAKHLAHPLVQFTGTLVPGRRIHRFIMAILQGDLSTLTLYTTVELPSSVLSIIKRDFGLGNNEAYNPFCRLEISARTDLYGLSTPEDVLRRLEAEGLYKPTGFTPFLLADQRTLDYPEDGVVWFIERWAEEEDFEGELLADNVDRTLEDGHFKFAHKELIYSY